MKNTLFVGFALLMILNCGNALHVSSYFKPVNPEDMGAPTEIDDEGRVSDTGGWVLSVEIAVPEDVKLVRPDGSVVGDELCVGDTFKVVASSSNDGEYFDEGGYIGSPKIYWVSDVAETAKQIVGCPGTNANAFAGPISQAKLSVGSVLCSDDPMKDFIDLSSFVESVRTALIYGGLACSVGTGEIVHDGIVRSGNGYKATSPGDVEFTSSAEVDCLYYHQTQDGGLGVAAPVYTSTCEGRETSMPSDQSPFLLVMGAGCDVLNASGFVVGELKFSKKITVVSGGKPDIDFSVIGGDGIIPGSEKILTVLVKNTGSVDLKVNEVGSNGEYAFIVCDEKTIQPGGETECLLSVTPGEGESLSVEVSYEYSNCGKPGKGKVSKVILESMAVNPSKSAQSYGIEVHGDCENEYYSCGETDGKGGFSAGYQCIKKEGYYTPMTGRFNLAFDLSGFHSNAEILSAKLKLFVAGINKVQDVGLYSIGDDWSAPSCVPGGDICTQPYCGECSPVFDASGSLISSLKIMNAGTQSFDITEEVKKALAGDRKLSFQLRGNEDIWAIEGVGSCSKEDEWNRHDVEFHGSEGATPHLEVVYR